MVERVAADLVPDPMNQKPSAARSGFTLIELLLVITIIAVLAGMLFPVGTQIIERARTTMCMNNLRQLGIAALASADDNDGRFPAIESDAKNPIYGPEDGAKPLSEAFLRYGIGPAQLQCPSDLKGPNWFKETGSSFMWQPYSEDEPKESITIYTRRGQFPGRQSRVRLATDYEAVHYPEIKGGRKRFNTLYADGHVTLR